LTGLIEGRGRAEVTALNKQEVEDAVGGLSNESKHAAALCVDAARAVARVMTG
jgi:hypothetical protein